ncbi:MAG: hypothetical protein V4582_04550 [Pseudomonadota bacterium]
MKRLSNWLALLACAMLLAACGGGGGSPGSVSGTAGGNSPTMAIGFVNASGQAANTTTNASLLTAKVALTDGNGHALSNVLVTFTTNKDLAVFSPSAGTSLTDANGIASMTLVPASGTASGAAALNVSAAIGAATLTGSANFNVVTVAAPQANISVGLINSGGQSSNTLSNTSPLTAVAVVTDAAGHAVANALVNFTGDDNLIALSPTNGTSLTNANGVATALLSAKSNAANGASTLTASASIGGSDISSRVNFTVQASTVRSANITLAFFNASGQPSTSVTSAAPLTAKARVLDGSGLPVAAARVVFATDSTLALFSPSNGSALTDVNGYASVTLRPASLAASGAGTVIAGTSVNNVGLAPAIANYSIGDAQLTLSAVRLSPATIPAYGSSVVSIDVLSAGVKYADQQMNVNFTSACVAAGKASFAAIVPTNGGTATGVFRDLGCANNDVITASVDGVSRASSATIAIGVPAAASIQFVSAVPIDKSIVIKGQGGITRTETATLKFKVFDIFNNPLPGKLVTFSKTASNVDVTLNKLSDSTDQNGEVITTVNSGTTPTTFRIVASLGGGVSTLSDSIVVTTGQPVQKAMSLTPTIANFEGWTYDSGTTVPATNINILLADNFGNPVADGTPVAFQTNMGAVGSSSKGACNTVNGGCSVDFRSQQPRLPLPNSPITPCNSRSGGSNDATRIGVATVCASTPDNASVLFSKIALFFSGSVANNVYMNGSDTPLSPGGVVDLGPIAAGKSLTFQLQINDINNNPMPAGSLVEMVSVFNANAIGVSPKTVPNIIPHSSSADDITGNTISGNQGSYHNVSVGSTLSATCTGPLDASFVVTVTTPRGTVTPFGFKAQMTCP